MILLAKSQTASRAYRVGLGLAALRPNTLMAA